MTQPHSAPSPALLVAALRRLSFALCPLSFALCPLPSTPLPLPPFDRIVIDDDFPGAYQVEVADINGDKKPDIIAVGGGTCAWYENPSWTKRIITGPDQTPGIISSATADLDGDGRAEVAIAYDFEMNNPKRGKLLLAVQDPDADGGNAWTCVRVADVPSIHRLRWADMAGKADGKLDLVVAPIFGPDATPPDFDQDPARVEIFTLEGPPATGRWRRRTIARRTILHAIDVLRASESGQEDSLLTADSQGVAQVWFVGGDVKDYTLVDRLSGTAAEPAERAASEVHLGRLADGRNFLATISPWHGSSVVVWPSVGKAGIDTLSFFERVVIDDTLDAGHALWVADVDGDGDDEIFAGHRGKDHRVSVYDFDGTRWNRTVLDRAIAAQDLRGGDLDGDGVPDVVAVGGSTHNVVWYRPRRGR